MDSGPVLRADPQPAGLPDPELPLELLAELPADADVLTADGTVVRATCAAREPRADVATPITVALPGGLTCRIPVAVTADERERAAAAFAVTSADALSRILNVRRTVGRLADLAVPRYGTSSLVAVVIEDAVRSAHGGVDRPGEPKPEAVHRLLDSLSSAEPVRQQVLRGDDDLLRDLHLTGSAGSADSADSADSAGSATWTVLSTALLRDAVTGTTGVLAVCGPVGAIPDPVELAALAARGATAVSAARVYEERAALADRLRASLLPAPLPAIPGAQLGASYRPARETIQLGGDFYDVFPAGPEAWTVSIGDVCGKGVDAAVLTGQVRQSLRTACRVSDDPSAVLRLVNDTLLTGDGSTFVTLLHATLRAVDGGLHLRLAAGGHPPPLVLRGSRVEVVRAHGTIVGMLDDVEFSTVDVHLAHGDTLLMFTDGVLEAGSPTAPLGVRPVADLLADCEDLTAQAVTERVLQLVLEHLDQSATAESHDDIAVLAVRADPAGVR